MSIDSSSTLYHQLVAYAEQQNTTVDNLIDALEAGTNNHIITDEMSDYVTQLQHATQLVTRGYRLDQLYTNFTTYFHALLDYDLGVFILNKEVTTISHTDNRISDEAWTNLDWDLFELSIIDEPTIWDPVQSADLAIVFRPLDIQSSILFPLTIGDENFGMLIFMSQVSGHFVSNHIQKILPFVNLASGAIQNSRLLNTISQSADELARLYHATSVLFRADNVVDFAAQITEVVIRTFEYTDCGLLIVDNESQEIIRVKRAGPRMAQPKHKMLIQSKGLVPKAVREGTLIYEPDVRNSTDYVAGDERSLSELVVPLKANQGIVGVLDFQSSMTYAFNERDRRLMVAFAERVAPVLENVLLYDKLRQYTIELEKHITERTMELVRTKEQIETILRSSPDAIVLLDSNGIIQQANLSWLSMVGASSPEVFGQPLTNFLQEQNRPLLREMLQKTLKDKLENDLVVGLHNSKRKSQIEIEISLAPVIEGLSQGIVCNIRDVTKRIKTERILRDALEKSEELNDLKSNFVTMASHEFRTPLTTILSSSDIIANYFHKLTTDDVFNHLQKIIGEVHYLNNLIDDILVIGRNGEGSFSCDYKLINFADLVQDAVRRVKTDDSNQHPIHVKIGRGCKSIVSDKKLISYILNNLLSNACKYSEGGSPISLDVSMGAMLNLKVTDRGMGIPDDDLKHLFETFHRGSNVGNIRGTGIGLAIVSQAVDALDGTIDIRSKVNHGTIVTVALPVVNDSILE
jgi:PAS domain S-box-containing protein